MSQSQPVDNTNSNQLSTSHPMSGQQQNVQILSLQAKQKKTKISYFGNLFGNLSISSGASSTATTMTSTDGYVHAVLVGGDAMSSHGKSTFARLGNDLTQGWKTRKNPDDIRKDMQAHAERLKKAADKSSVRVASTRVANENAGVTVRRSSVRVKVTDGSGNDAQPKPVEIQSPRNIQRPTSKP